LSTKINNNDRLFLELVETLFSINTQYENIMWDLDLPKFRLCYMIDDYEELFQENKYESAVTLPG